MGNGQSMAIHAETKGLSELIHVGVAVRFVASCNNHFKFAVSRCMVGGKKITILHNFAGGTAIQGNVNLFTNIRLWG